MKNTKNKLVYSRPENRRIFKKKSGMALLLKVAYHGYNYLFTDIADPRANAYPFMKTPFPIIILLAAYCKFVFNWGPKWMEKREPFNLQKVLLFFNLFQVIANAGLLIHGRQLIIDFKWHCDPVDFTNSERGLWQVKLAYCYHLLKLTDLLDTIFFVLKKNNRQITFLHVYHHFGMCGLTWIATKFLPGGHSFLIGIINCFVHLVMYFYYLLTVWDEKYKNNVWWKKHITQLQLAQFFIFIVSFGRLFFVECSFPKIASYFMVVQNLFMIILFGEFYYNTYVKKKTIPAKTS